MNLEKHQENDKSFLPLFLLVYPFPWGVFSRQPQDIDGHEEELHDQFPRLKSALRLAALAFFCVLTFVARSHNLRDVFIEGRLYFLDADCYSRMTRAQMVAEHPGMIIRHHDFENFPQGVKTHTTAPLDYLIVLLKSGVAIALRFFDPQKTTSLHAQALDIAGALIGPLLGTLSTVFLAFWAWSLRFRFWGIPLLLYATSPILVHGTVFGRPDHQALLILLLTVALGAEIALVRPTLDLEANSATHQRFWSVVSGLFWALSLWVSLYEPLVLLATVVVIGLALDRRSMFSQERRRGWVVFLITLALVTMVEGWHMDAPDAALRANFIRWQATIGELAHLNLLSPQLSSWLGWLALLTPLGLFFSRKTDRRSLPLLLLLIVLLSLTVWQIRWGYFLAVGVVLSLPIFLPVLVKPWIIWTAFFCGLWPLAADWEARLFPDSSATRRLEMKRAESVALREIVATKVGTNGGPFLAPWWLSPAIAYWTGQPGLGGSSHESLPGIVDGAKIYLAPDAATALPILRSHRIAWILADVPERVIATSATLLGVDRPSQSMAEQWARPIRDEPRDSAIIPDPSIPLHQGEIFYQIWIVQPVSDLLPN